MSIPEPAAVRVTAGVEGPKEDHVVCVVGEQAEVIERFTVAHDAAGLARMCRRLLKAGVEQVGIERGDGPVVEALPRAGVTLFVIPPGQVKNLRAHRPGRAPVLCCGRRAETGERGAAPGQTAVTAAAAIRELSEANADLVNWQSETQHQLNEVREANEHHEAWDMLMVETLRKRRDALAAAGIVVDIRDLPDPPRLARITRPASPGEMSSARITGP